MRCQVKYATKQHHHEAPFRMSDPMHDESEAHAERDRSGSARGTPGWATAASPSLVSQAHSACRAAVHRRARLPRGHPGGGARLRRADEDRAGAGTTHKVRGVRSTDGI